jgi:hypothetical protein
MSEIMRHCAFETDLGEYAAQLADAQVRDDRAAAIKAGDEFVARVRAGVNPGPKLTRKLSDIGRRDA